ncbi:caspase-14-like [Hemiscyllium ocellatum]|uniref:caspase-14-like n=1 Tax=Hemiscyllium ocellatum TaxID=170820 RepID=UPI002967414F|nr:caspase-14-like [Hemiscyllium ocellatum]XP_060679321.1 caspase-14-like [Hemiscyllium ocellatum]
MTEDRYDMSGDRVAFLLCVKKDRSGAEEDLKRLRNLLDYFHFQVKECIDPKEEEIIPAMEQFREELKPPRNVSCAFFFLMTHGNNTCIFGAPRETGVELEVIFEMFNNEGCPQLQNKPKVFIIQACRGVKVDRGVVTAGFRLMTTEDDDEPKTLPTMSDTFTVYPSPIGYVAFRDPLQGSFLITFMDEVFRDVGNQFHLYDLFVKVNHRMVRKEMKYKNSIVKTTLVMESTLTKALYLTE